MNQSKKLIKSQGVNAKVKEKNPAGKKGFKIVIGTGILLTVLICSIIVYEQMHRKLVVQVDGEKVYMDEMMYYIYSTEATYNYMNQIYASMGSDVDYWNMEQDGGKTTKEVAKEEALATSIQYEILYKEAINAKFEVTKEDKASAKEEAEKIMGQLTKVQKSKTGFTNEKLTAVLEKKAMTDRYSQKLIDGFDIDDEAIKAEINYDDYRQYDIQYYFAPTKTSDEEGKEKEATAKEKKDFLNKMTDLLQKAKKAEDFTTLLKEGDESGITYQPANILETDENFSKEFIDKVIKMENDLISDIIETEKGYYFVKMINNNSSAQYDQAVTGAIGKKENEAFKEEYAKIYKKYEVKVNNKEWDKIEVGSITT